MTQSRNRSAEKGPRRRVRLDHRRRGYLLDGLLQRGFPDSEELSEAERLLVARWAQRFAPEEMSEAQRRLLTTPEAERHVSAAQRELRDNQLELRSPYLEGLYESLGEEERRLVEDPAASPKTEGRTYPLSVGDLARLSGASERQVRKWADDGLLPSYRDRNQRRFYSAALIRAFAIARISAQEKAVLSAAAHGRAGHLFQLIAATMGRAATRLPDDEAVQLAMLAQELSCSSRLMFDVEPRSEVAQMWEKAHRGKGLPRRTCGPVFERVEVAVHTEPREEGWANVIVGNTIASSIHATKAEAELHGRAIAVAKGAVHVVHRRDGTIGAKRGYGSRFAG